MLNSKGVFLINVIKHICGTTKHKIIVFYYLLIFCIKLLYRGMVHDLSKYSLYETKYFAEVISLLRGCSYGSVVYKESLHYIKPAIEHHYKKSKHHPEHWENGINDMSLLDIVEMVYDWKAATKRHNDGNIERSLNINKSRFNLSDDISDVLKNTVGKG